MALVSESTETVIAMGDLTDTTLFKVLDGLSPVHGGGGRYPSDGWSEDFYLPWQPYELGYYLARGPQVLGWLGPTLYVAEACPDHPPVDDSHELVTCRVRLVRRLDRWDETTARLFAADCAEAALLGERASGREPDERSWAAVDAVRRYARGEIDRVEFNAARDAAWDVVWETPPPHWATALADHAAWAAAKAVADRAPARVAAARVAAAARDAAGDAVEAAAWAGHDRQAAQVALYRRLCAYLEGAPIPPVEPLYGVVAKEQK